MSQPIIEPISDAGGDRYLDFRAVLLHNNHLQSGKRTAQNCGLCTEGLASAINTLEEITATDQQVEMVSGDGANQGRDAPSSPSDGGSGSPAGELLGDERRFRDQPVRETFR